MSQPKVFVRTSYSDTYKNIPVSAFFAHSSDKGFEITIYVDEEDYAPEPMQESAPGTIFVRRTIETRLTISPMQTKALQSMLGQQLKAYEEIFGPIPTQEEVQAKIASKFKGRQFPTSTETDATKGNVGIQ